MPDTFFNPLDVVEIAATPTTPASGYQRSYPKSNGKWYVLNSAGVETQITNEATATQTFLNLDGGASDTTFPEYLVRLDFGADGSTINPSGTP